MTPLLLVRLALVWVVVLPLQAQILQVLSEFRRVDAAGKILPSDSPGKPREILSPGLVRNGYHSIRFVIRPPANKPYTVELAQNPDAAIELRLYREKGDTLVPVKVPVAAMGGIVETYWLDMRVPKDAEVRRVRVEVQLHDGDTWHIHPMEVRILPAVLPSLKVSSGAQAPLGAVSDANARLPWREWLCNETPKAAVPVPRALSVRAMLRRNALQDVALGRLLGLKWGKERLLGNIAESLGTPDIPTWCAAPPTAPHPDGPERYLKLRDMLYREASH
jgi:hypothetical protein